MKNIIQMAMKAITSSLPIASLKSSMVVNATKPPISPPARAISTVFYSKEKAPAREYSVISSAKTASHKGAIIVKRGVYEFDPSLRDEKYENDPVLYFSAFLHKEFGTPLPKDSLFVVFSPTKHTARIDDPSEAARLDPAHIYAFATGAGELDQSMHIDFTRSEISLSTLEKTFIRPEIGFSHKDLPVEMKYGRQEVRKGMLISNESRFALDHKSMKLDLKMPSKTPRELAIVVLPGFDYNARKLMSAKLHALIEKSIDKGKDDFITKINYVLSGGERVTAQREPVIEKGAIALLHPSNCVTVFFNIAKNRLEPYDASVDKEYKKLDYEKELYRAYPVTGLALLVEHEYGFAVAKQVVMALAQSRSFLANLEKSRYSEFVSGKENPRVIPYPESSAFDR